MKSRVQSGFTLIEILVVVSIMAIVAMTIYITPEDSLTAKPLSQARQLQGILTNTRRETMRAGLPRQLVRSGGSLFIREWSQASGDWLAPSRESTRALLSTQYSFKVEKSAINNAHYSRPSGKSNNEVFSDLDAQSITFWPDGTSSGGKIVLDSNYDDTHQIRISPAGLVRINE